MTTTARCWRREVSGTKGSSSDVTGDSRCRQPWQRCRAALVRGQAGREQCPQCAPHKGAVLPPERAHPLVPAPSPLGNARKARVWAGVPCSSPPRAGTAQPWLHGSVRGTGQARESWWRKSLGAAKGLASHPSDCGFGLQKQGQHLNYNGDNDNN